VLAAALVALALAAPPVTHDVVPVVVAPVHPGTARGVDYEYTWGSKAGAIPHLGVFDRPRRARDVLPRVARTFVRFAHADVRASRLLLSTGSTRIYAVPKDRGAQLCVLREPSGGGTCVGSFAHDAYPQVQPRDAVWGVVDDGAVQVDVTIAHDVVHARLGRNAFFLALPHGAVAPSRIVVRERDGTRHVYVVKRLRPA